MQIVLLVAGVVSLYPLKEFETGIVLVALTLFNAVLGLQQEGKAAAAVAGAAEDDDRQGQGHCATASSPRSQRLSWFPVTWWPSRPATSFRPTGG